MDNNKETKKVNDDYIQLMDDYIKEHGSLDGFIEERTRITHKQNMEKDGEKDITKLIFEENMIRVVIDEDKLSEK